MLTVNLDKDLCLKCTTIDCLVRCRYLGLDLEQATQERDRLMAEENSQVLEDCVTCYACEEYCPYGNHPFYLIVELQERHGIHPVPKEIEEHQVASLAPKGKIQYREMHAPVIDLCTFPMLKDSITGPLFENASFFWGTDVFCNLMYLHFGKTSLINERLQKNIDNIWNFYLKPNNLDTLVCYHDECYATFTSYAQAYGIEVPFTPVHLFDFIIERLTELKDRIIPLNIRAAYHRNCSNRLIPETHDRVDEIFQMIGVERVERQYEDDNTLCCGLSFDAQQRKDLARDTQKKILDDIQTSGATYCVYNCPMCLFTLQDKVRSINVTPILMPDLCQKALGA